MARRRSSKSVEVVGTLRFNEAAGRVEIPLAIFRDEATWLDVIEPPDQRAGRELVESQQREPVSLDPYLKMQGFWAYRNRVVTVSANSALTPEEKVLHIKHAVRQEEVSLQQMRRELEAMENMDRVPSAQRERIPEHVRLFVWQRDQGKCVSCGSRKDLEFDHIIPVAEGGSSTERNVQLLCVSCNRRKGRRI